MKETFTEEEYQEISKLYSSEVLKNHLLTYKPLLS